MKRWRTRDMTRCLYDPKWSIALYKPEGVTDTTNLLLTAYLAQPNNSLLVRGFVTGGRRIETPDDCGIEMIEVTDGLHRRGGLNTGDTATARMYAEVCIRLRRDNYQVVPTIKSFEEGSPVSKKGEKARSAIHLAASRTAGAIRLTITALKRGVTEGPSLRTGTVEDEARLIVSNAPNLDFTVNVRNSIAETAQAILADLPTILTAEDKLDRLNVHLAKMELVQDITTE